MDDQGRLSNSTGAKSGFKVGMGWATVEENENC